MDLADSEYSHYKNLKFNRFGIFESVFAKINIFRLRLTKAQNDTFRVWRAIILLMRVKCFGPVRVNPHFISPHFL